MLIAGSITGIYLVLAVVVTMTLIAADNKVFSAAIPTPRPAADTGPFDEPPAENEAQPQSTPTPAPENDEGMLKPPARTIFLLVGLDKDQLLTDALMAGCFYRDTSEIKLMSIPRDLYTRIPQERLERMRADGLRPPSSGVMKINALRSYGGGRAQGIQYLQEQLGEMLGVTFQYYVEVDIPAFKKIVDMLGGVEIDIPKGGLYYDDPVQNLHIAIPEGKRLIKGDDAEGLVRFRRYQTGDLGRNAMQMVFMKELFRQVLKRENIMRDPATVIDVILNDVRTNIGMDLIKYLPYASKLDGGLLTTHTMPGDGEYIGEASYFLPDSKELPNTINEVFYSIPVVPEDVSGADE